MRCYIHQLFAGHDPGPGHPERPARAVAVADAVAASGLPVEEAPAASDDALRAVHPAGYLAAIAALCERGGGALDADTVVNAVSFEAARHASGAGIAGVDLVLSGAERDVFSMGRPPGHHAGTARAMGFCIVNHAAVAARHAIRSGAERVAIVDWDAHHGNGTQEIFWTDPHVLYVSIHQSPHYPGTGAASERGGGPGEGATLNLPVAAGIADDAYLELFTERVLPAVRAHSPEVVVVSAGFDAHRADPLCSLALSSAAFGRMATALGELDAGRVYLLEGGYDLTALEESVGEVLAALAA